jgi:hypothetical protein
LNHSLLFVQLAVERNALPALSLIQMPCESIDVGVPKFLARFQVWRALQDSNHFFWQFVASILASSHDYFFSLGASADQPYRCGLSSIGPGQSVEDRFSVSVSITLIMCLLLSPVLTASLTALKIVCIALRCSTVGRARTREQVRYSTADRLAAGLR